jgi:hypothetical protein
VEVPVKKHVLFMIFLFSSIVLSGCQMFSGVKSTPDEVATQVVRWLTASAQVVIAEPTLTLTAFLTPTLTVEAPTMTPSITITETITSTVTQTQSLDDPAVYLGDAVWREDFSGNSSPWDFDSAQAVFQTNNGSLNLTARLNQNWHSWYVSSPKLKNAYVQATIELSACSGMDRMGLAVRSASDGQQFYYMSITCDGQWGFFRMAEEVNINQVLGYQSHEQLTTNANQPLRIGIWMDGTAFSFYINGEKVGEATDNTLTGEGFTGFLIAYANTPGFTVRVEELSYWNVP